MALLVTLFAAQFFVAPAYLLSSKMSPLSVLWGFAGVLAAGGVMAAAPAW